MVALYLDEKPLQWYKWTVKSKGSPLEREEFEKGLISLYNPSTNMEYAGELSKLKQGLSCDGYQAEFMCLSHHSMT